MNYNKLSQVHPEQALCDHCSRNTHYLIVHKSIVSRLIAILLFISFFIFVIGYFLGKKKIAEDFSQKVELSSFSDQINFALTALYAKELNTEKNKEVALFDENNNEIPDSADQRLIQPQPEQPLLASTSVDQKPVSDKKWAAQLLGGTQKNVTEFAQRLDKKGISVVVKKRSGRTARGKKIHWYQAVTQPYEDKTELQTLVAQIKKLENIKVTNDTIVPLST